MGAEDRTGRWRTRALWTLAALLGFVLAAEVAYRVRTYGFAGLSPALMNSVCRLPESGLVRASAVREIRHELVPDLRTHFKMARFETNARGMRDVEVELAKPPGTRRAAVIGDSVTMGSGVELPETYHSVLERLWNERGGEPTWECLNFGVGGYTLAHYRAVLEHRALAFAPDLVLVGLTFGDRAPPSPGLFDEPYEPLPAVRPFLRLNLLDWLLARWRFARLADREADDGGGDDGEGDEGGGGRPEREPGSRRAYLVEELAAMRALGEAAGAPVVAVYLNTTQTRKSESVSALFRDAAREAGVPYLDLSPLFRGLDPARFRIFPNDSHPNAEAHRMFADAIAGWLSELGLAP